VSNACVRFAGWPDTGFSSSGISVLPFGVIAMPSKPPLV
jgi:hypothetical protein